MLQVRKLVLAVAAVTAFTSSYTHALGLGDIAVKSSLNQPLEAEISLLEVRDLTSVEIKSRLASPEEFSKAGVDRQFFLTGLTFTPVIDSSGKKVIRVTSQQAVKEPYLNFLVEVIWPNGRLLREYTVLLDPPLYAPQQVIYAPEPAVTRATAPVRPTAQPVRQAQTPARAAATPRAVAGGEYRVQRNDTLWEIAMRVRGNASVHQAMLAIQDLNPNAFVNGNINRMKSGQVLRLPSAQEINSRSQAQAIAQVAQQNDSWKAGSVTPEPALAERQLDATHRAEAGAAPAAVEKTDNLRLVADAPGDAQQAADEGAATNIEALQNQLARNQEFLDSTTLENEELKERVDDLSSQLDKLQRLIELKDNQLAQLQNAAGTADTMLDLQTAETIADLDTADDSLSELSDSMTDSAMDEDLETPLDTAALSQPDMLEMDEEAVSETADTVAALAEDANESEADAAEPAPLAPTPSEPSVQEKSLVDTVMDNPTLLAAAGGVTILGLLLVLMGLSRSRARKEAALNEAQPAVTASPEKPDFDELSAFDEQPLEQTDDPLTADPLAFDTAEPVAEAQFKEEESDPIVEADNYIGFGRFNQAAEVLNKALEDAPERIDLRHKLLEVYADLEDQAGFSQQINEITEIGGADAELAQAKARYPHMFSAKQVIDVSLDNDFADLDLDEQALDEPAAETLTASTELDAELDDLSALLADTQGDTAEESKETDFDFDFDLDLDLSKSDASADAGDQQQENEAAVEGLDDLALDLESLDLDLAALEDTEAAAEQARSTEEFSLDELSQGLEEPLPTEQSDFQTADDFTFEDLEQEEQQADLADFDLQLDDLVREDDSLTASAETEPLNDDEQLDESAQIESMLDNVLAESSAETDESTVPNDPTDLGDLESLDGIDDDFSFLSGTDETATKLDLARAYIDMGDAEGARDILEEVITEGTAAQQDEARELVNQLG